MNMPAGFDTFPSIHSESQSSVPERPSSGMMFPLDDSDPTTYRPADFYNAGRPGFASVAGVGYSERSALKAIPTEFEIKSISPYTSVIQLWEGKVLGIDGESNAMHVVLFPKLGKEEPHTADIDLQWVSEQDSKLVRPGAIFYLTLFKRTRRGGIENTQELRFRRLPTWSRKQLEQVDRDATMILSKMRARPSIE